MVLSNHSESEISVDIQEQESLWEEYVLIDGYEIRATNESVQWSSSNISNTLDADEPQPSKVSLEFLNDEDFIVAIENDDTATIDKYLNA